MRRMCRKGGVWAWMALAMAFPWLCAAGERVYFDGTQTGLFEVHESQGCYERDAEGCFLGESPAGNALAWRGLLPPTGKPRDNVELVFSPMDFLPGEWLSVEARNLGGEGVRLQARLANYSEGYACGSQFRVWASPYSREVPADGEWHRLEYRWDGTWIANDPASP